MKRSFNITILLMIIIFIGCDKNEIVEPQVEKHKEESSIYIVPGIIGLTFADTLSKVQAECFLNSLGLTTYALGSFDNPFLHTGSIEVPEGQEDAWIEILLQYKEIKSADRLVMMTQPVLKTKSFQE